VTKKSQIKFVPNLEHAKAVFRVDCPNNDCIGGDFDLSKDIAQAVAEKRTAFATEVYGQGWLSKITIGTVHCHNCLRYKLSLNY
jgi:hypothetical protein